MACLASLLLGVIGQRAAHRFERATRDPEAAQREKLLWITQKNKDTEYGRAHGFHNVRSLADWRHCAPVIGYEDIRAEIDRMANGEKNVLTAETPVMFAQTSGTSGDPKLIPVTPTCRGRDHSDQMRTWLHHAQRDHGIYRSKVVSLVSPAVEGHTKSGIPFGSTTGQIYRDLPAIVRSTYAIPYELFEIEDYEAKYYALMRLAIAADVSFVCTGNPSSIVKMCEIADREGEALLRDIADGTLREDLDIDPKIRTAVLAHCRRDAARARELEGKRKQRDGRLLPGDYWPKLALIGCWKGGTVGSYVERFPEWFDPDGTKPVPVRDWGYLASEGRCSIPLGDEGSGGVLTVATNVYEFVDVDALEKKPDDWTQWPFRGAAELEKGKEYYVFLTTTGGLYRYDINDVVEVVGKSHETPVIEFRRKGRGMTSLTGEKVSVNQVIAAVEAAAQAHGVKVDHFVALADVEKGGYVLQVETEGEPSEADLRAFAKTFDEELGKANVEYAGKRKSMRLAAPVLQRMQNGWYEDRKRELVAAGKRLFQAKTALLKVREPDAEDESKWVAQTLDPDGKDGQDGKARSKQKPEQEPKQQPKQQQKEKKEEPA